MADGDVQSLKPARGAHDSHRTGHGTQMAGLIVYGDLAPRLAASKPILLFHGVRSLKLINDRDPHREDLYGVVTIEGVSRLEVDPSKPSLYCMAITAGACARGRPPDRRQPSTTSPAEQSMTPAGSSLSLQAIRARRKKLIIRLPKRHRFKILPKPGMCSRSAAILKRHSLTMRETLAGHR